MFNLIQNCTGGSVLKSDTTPEYEEDNISERSFGSISSSQSCDVEMGMKKMSVGLWSSVTRRSRNVLHCTHAHKQDPEDYLTPTQRATRKIKELQVIILII